MVTSFGFRSGGGINNIDTIFFTIDQTGLRIFNADSMPVGTRLDNLVPKVTTRGASAIEFHVTRTGKPDTIYNYLDDGMDSIDFSRNDVVLRIVSLDGQATSQYKIRLNVHTVKGDTLVWQRLDRNTLPSRFTAVNEQHTAMTADYYYCLTRYQNDYCLARTDNPGETWSYITPVFGFTPDMDTFNATKDKLYILDTTGNLYESADDGATWTRTGRKWNYIYGGYGDRLIGSLQRNGAWLHVEYPASTESPMSADFPVCNTSQSVCRSFEMSTSMQMVITGGRLADNTLTEATWSFDGTQWARINRTNAIGHGVENMVLVPYFSVRTDTASWVTTSKSVLMAMFGNEADGTLNDTIYVSADFGMNWTKAASNMQTPKAIPARTMAQGFVYYDKLYVKGGSKVRRTAGWSPLENGGWATVFDADVARVPSPMLKITKPVTDWECPYLYLFGGKNRDGLTYNSLYRGVIVSFEFVPIH